MSPTPKPTDSLDQLKELILGDELRELLVLSERLKELDEDSVDRLARDLAAALHRRREMGDQSYDELVAAIQPGLESAIQRSVTEDKSTLSKALFPIMGPAIRNYVVDLFRGMVEEFNETVRNTTSAERIKWRFQAKLAGKSYSEFVILKTRSFFTEEVYLMERGTGLLLLHAARNSEEEASGEADLVSGMFTAIRSFVKDSFARGEASEGDGSELDSFTFGEREVLIEVGPSMIVAAVTFGVPPASAKDELKSILEDLHGELGDRLRTYSGEMEQLEIGRPTLRRALLESRETESADERGTGMWRAWLAFGVIVLSAAAISFFGMREQGKWDGFVEALRSELGVAVTAVENDGWWRHRTVRGVRDPLATNPAMIAEQHGIAPEKTTFAFEFIESMEPPFTSRRKTQREEEQKKILAPLRDDLENSASTASVTGVQQNIDKSNAELKEVITALRSEIDNSASIASVTGVQQKIDKSNAELKEVIIALRSEIKAQRERERRVLEGLIRSQFAGFGGLTIEFDDASETARFAGDLAAQDYQEVSDRITPLAELIKVDTSELRDDSSARLARVLKQIEGIQILYLSGTLDEGDQQRMEALEKLTLELDKLALLLNRVYRFEVLAHPLIGPNRAGNRIVEARRAEQVRGQLTALGIAEDRITTRLSENFARGGEGVSVMVKKLGKDTESND